MVRTAAASRPLPGSEAYRYEAEITHAQFQALSRHVHSRAVLSDLQAMAAGSWAGLPSLAPQGGEATARWLKNAWDTEAMLQANASLLDDDSQAFALQWAFPQAYYSAFAMTVAFLHAFGYPETQHIEVIRRFGEWAAAGRYPARVSCLATGGPGEIHCLEAVPGGGFQALVPPGRKRHPDRERLCQFLATTRRLFLAKRRKDFPVLNALGEPKLRIGREDWDSISASLGYTSVLSLLYRKRRKSYFVDLDTFAYEHGMAREIHADLVRIVSTLNFVHETLLCGAMGAPAWGEMVARAAGGNPPGFLQTRRKWMERLVPASPAPR